MKQLNPDKVQWALDFLSQTAHNHLRQITWLWVMVGHLVVTVLCLAALWWFQVQPIAMATALTGHDMPLSIGHETMALLGLSALGLLWAYLRAWRWLIAKLLMRLMPLD